MPYFVSSGDVQLLFLSIIFTFLYVRVIFVIKIR